MGNAFRMLMEIRMLLAAVSMLLLPQDQLSLTAFTLVLSMVVLSWIAARQWRITAPKMAKHPLLYTLDMCLSFAVLGLGGISGPYFLSTVATATVAGLLYRWQGMLAVAGLQILVYYATYALSAVDHPENATFQTVLGQPIYYPLAGFAGVALRRLLDDFADKESALRQAEVVAAAEQERARLAREMHDTLAKTLRGIALSAAALPTWVARDAARAKAEAQRVAAASELASREVRTLLADLRDGVVLHSLPDAIRDVAERWEADTGTPVRCELLARPELALRVRHEVIAILGEVLTNIDRHAQADSVHIRLSEEEADVVLVIRDDGKGFTPRELPDLAREGHYGLVGLNERAQRAGGSVDVLSAPGSGTTVAVRIPAQTSEEQQLAEVS
ncbi:sensor histidine kinase [Spirillospora sp. CA-294931]|uniref:sensor histidine kinase n=1 Tax=Spirillospora sp. CA-294931 TaxID=3240042 RepID=UPI003D8A7609